jgi:hypothetical protein
MFLATSNKPRQLLNLNFIGAVSAAEVERGVEDVRLLLADLKPGFRSLADFSRLESMSLDCTTPMGKMMELADGHGLDMVVRVMPDPAKDIGLNILSAFHYPNHPRIVTCETMAEAFRALGL